MSEQSTAGTTGDDEVRVRRAGPGDEAEVVRLRELMSSTLFGPGAEGPWTGEAMARLARWLADPDAATAVFVVDAPDGAGLAASVIGTYSERLPSARNPAGLSGYVYGVSTDPRWQRRGFSRAAMTALLDWFDRCGVVRIDLHASEFGEGLYRKLGFAETRGAALSAHR
ncbi:GNAT family N-acetyltransferase [Streptacidiphilus sp. P02-A3a]|uniref:GNAT family N-acetyltransferase n=1 Tax=Streptacidiphilus sp. P02-A3a TaxID=2704468 RepID=UPI0015FD66ED|nr:GNAT family N-acetyltransferase [Streptacidiphilus sp. P02-A3a]QMU69537.1 GNAT family N-acetyltransferase [Streptacidiphilus sp. P02-A3a]